MPPRAARPPAQVLAAAYGGTVPDLVAPGLRVLLVGINPSLWSAAIGHHFGNPANRLWPTLHAAGFTTRRLLPSESGELLAAGIGISNMVRRATATAAEISDAEIRAGRRRVEQTVRRWSPDHVAFLGLSAYRTAYGEPGAIVGRQARIIGRSAVWLLPNPSGLNAHYRPSDLAGMFRALRLAVEDGAH